MLRRRGARGRLPGRGRVAASLASGGVRGGGETRTAAGLRAAGSRRLPRAPDRRRAVLPRARAIVAARADRLARACGPTGHGRGNRAARGDRRLLPAAVRAGAVEPLLRELPWNAPGAVLRGGRRPRERLDDGEADLILHRVEQERCADRMGRSGQGALRARGGAGFPARARAARGSPGASARVHAMRHARHREAYAAPRATSPSRARASARSPIS